MISVVIFCQLTLPLLASIFCLINTLWVLRASATLVGTGVYEVEESGKRGHMSVLVSQYFVLFLL